MPSLKLLAATAVIFVPHIPELLALVDPVSIGFLAIQLAEISLFRLGGSKNVFLKKLFEIDEINIVIASLLSLGLRLVLLGTPLGKVAELISKAVLIIGAAPILNEAIDSYKDMTGFKTSAVEEDDEIEEEEEEDVDLPALMSMELGLLLNYVPASLVILIMLTGGEALEGYALKRAQKDVQDLINSAPKVAHKKEGNEIVDISVDEVQIGDLIVVRSNESVSVDGKLVEKDEDAVLIDEQTLTGELLPKSKNVNDKIYAGCINVSQQAITLEATSLWSDSVFARMQAEMEKCLESESRMELRSKLRSDQFIDFTLLLVASSFIFNRYYLGLTSSESWETVLSVFMAATPCPLVIGVPVAFLSGMSILTKNFTCTVKSASVIENLASANVVVLDKTGTVTNGVPVVQDIVLETDGGLDLSIQQVKRLLASLEFSSPHPLAEAVVSHFHNSDDQSLLKATEITQTQGKGIEGLVELTPSATYKVDIGAKEALTNVNIPKGTLVTAFSILNYSDPSSGEAKGYILFQDELREGAPAMIKGLKERVKKIVVLSGDRSTHLEVICEQLGLEDYKSCWPAEKGEEVRNLRTDTQKVIMVGDGVNDAAALAGADLGIAVGSGGLAEKAADLVLLQESSVTKLPEMIDTCKKVIRVATTTVTIGMSLSCCQMILAATRVIDPFTSATLQEMVDLGTVLYSLTAFSLIDFSPQEYFRRFSRA